MKLAELLNVDTTKENWFKLLSKKGINPKTVSTVSKGGGSNTEEEHWIGVQFGTEDMGVNPFPLCTINFTTLGREIGGIYINKGIGMIQESYSSGNGYSAFGGLLTYGDIVTPYRSAHYGTYNYYTLLCVNIKQQERIMYSNINGAPQDGPISSNYDFGDGTYTLEEIENKILESKLFTNYSKNERILAILSVIGFLAYMTKCDEWYGNTPIDEYLTNAGVDMFTTLEIVYPNRDEMLEMVKQTVINYKG